MQAKGRITGPSLRDGLSRGETNDVVSAARARAQALTAAAEGNATATRLGALVFAADVVAGLALERTWPPEEIDALVQKLSKRTGLPPEAVKLAVHLQVAKDPRLLGLPPFLGIETIARTLLAFAPTTTASVWVADPRRPLECVVCVGDGQPTRRMRAAAEATVRRSRGTSSDHGSMHAVPIKRWQHVCGALVLRSHPRDRQRALAFARESIGALGLLLERESLLQRSAARERSLVESSERRLTRLGYDLHDGPLQDVGAAVRELRLLRSELARNRSANGAHDMLTGRLEELERIMVGAEGTLRELAQSFESPAILNRPFRETIEGEIESLAASTDIRATVELHGDFEALTDSQRIALIRIVQEALTNVREHSGADEVKISIRNSYDRVHAEVVDNGRGFDVERTLLEAARRGRLGLVGMNERVRLLGGNLEVDSRPGDSTVISVTLPQWRPLEPIPQMERTS